MGTKKGYSLSYDLRNSIWIVLCAGVFLLSSGTNSNLTLRVSCNFLWLSLLLGVSRSIGKRNLSKCMHNVALTTEENLTNTDCTISVKDEWLFKFMTIGLFSVKSTIVKNTKPFYYVSNKLPESYYIFIMLSNVMYEQWTDNKWLFKFMTIRLFSAKSTIVKNTKPFYYVSNGLTTNCQNRITTLSCFQM